ncbi:phage tail protein [Xenorhabdus sp. XENO-1]|uniref:phage tail-collar fiber domain-containing protein n=1 Tax=Xenorhabdus bovienii TaxID=40576 RepID=UPI0020CA3B39|nr:phage tail protein [Xenorhabdus bovienii]MCP9267848.1 phage tail protein [Xenorhabdus bovienii subsp. africana]
MSSVITTDFEKWKAQQVAASQPVVLDEFVFAYVPGLDPVQAISRDEKLPAVSQIVHRQAVNKTGLASENAVAYSVTLGTEVGDFDFNWIGLLNKASGVIGMITHAPTQKKIKTANGLQGNVLTRSFLLEFDGAALETAITTTAETWQIDFTARLSGIDEMQRLINTDSYGEAAFFGDGFTVVRQGEQYLVKKGLAYVGGLRGVLEFDQTLNSLRNTRVYADFSYQGNLVSQWKTVVKITAANELKNYVDAAGYPHYVFAVAQIDGDGNVQDLRPAGLLSDRNLKLIENKLSIDLNKKIDKASITGKLGNNNEFVPSQNLLTTALGEKINIEPSVLNGSELISEQLMNGFGVAIRGITPLPADAPAVDGAIKVVQIGNNAWPTQLAFSAYENKMFIRTRKASNGAWNDWLNITDYVTNASLSSHLRGKLDKSAVINAPGSSTTQVMSQKAVTDALAGYATNNNVSSQLGLKVNIESQVLNGSELISEQLMNGFGVAIRGSAPLPADAPAVDGAIKVVQIGHNAWPTLLAFSAYENKMFIRTRKTNNGSWNDWLDITDYVTNASLSSHLSVKLDKSAVVQTTGQRDYQVMSQQAVTDRLVGINQSWRDVTNQRSFGSTYTNKSEKAMAFVVSASSYGDGCAVGASVNGIESPGTFNYKVNAVSSSSLMIVPPGASYSARISSGSGRLITWLELS